MDVCVMIWCVNWSWGVISFSISKTFLSPPQFLSLSLCPLWNSRKISVRPCYSILRVLISLSYFLSLSFWAAFWITYIDVSSILPIRFFKKDLFIIIIIFLNVFLAALGLSCGKRGPLFIAVHGPLTIAASLVAEHRLQSRRLSSCGSRA